MNALKCLAAVLGLAFFVFGVANVSAQDGTGSEFITFTVDILPTETSGFVYLNILWDEVEGAASYDLHINSDIFSSEQNHDSIGIFFDSGDLEIEIIAYGPGDVELARSRKMIIRMPEPGSTYTGEGSISLESKYGYTFPDGTKLDGNECGKIERFFICQEEMEDGTGKKVLVDMIYGTGSASFMDTLEGSGYSIYITGRGKFDIFGNLNKVPVPEEGASCSMTLRLTTLYPVVYQEVCVAGSGCQKLPYFDWEESYVVEDFPTVALAVRETSKTVYEVVNKKNKYLLETIYIGAPAECRSYD